MFGCCLKTMPDVASRICSTQVVRVLAVPCQGQVARLVKVSIHRMPIFDSSDSSASHVRRMVSFSVARLGRYVTHEHAEALQHNHRRPQWVDFALESQSSKTEWAQKHRQKITASHLADSAHCSKFLAAAQCSLHRPGASFESRSAAEDGTEMLWKGMEMLLGGSCVKALVLW